MPNDIPDWTAQSKVNIVGGLSGVNLADVAAPSLAADSVQETLSGTGGFGGSGIIVLASFKAAAGQTIAKVGALGAIAVGTATSVSPTFGQSPTAGNLLVAWVTGASGSPTTGQAGWSKIKEDNGNGQFAAVWAKPNAAGGDAAPTFTIAGGSSLMSAQLGEFSGVATASPTDQTSSAQYTSNPVTVTNAAADVAFGDLVLTCSRVILSIPGTAIFSDTINNGGTVVQAGSAQVGSAAPRAANGTFTIIPAATVAQPLGTAPWAYDSSGTSAPAAGSNASVVLAATPGKTYIAAAFTVDVEASTAAAQQPNGQLLDGASVIWSCEPDVSGTIGNSATRGGPGYAYKGTTGNSMTLKTVTLAAGGFAVANLAAYLR